MEASELRAARDRLILKRKEMIKDLRTRRDSWPEFHQVCREIGELDQKLGEGVTDQALSSTPDE
jgi:hypothetical protein